MNTKVFQINKEFLDTFDFTPFLKNYSQLGEMMAAIEEHYRDIEMPAELENEFFNYYTERDFKEYLEKRYSGQLWFYPYEEYLIDFVDT